MSYDQQQPARGPGQEQPAQVETTRTTYTDGEPRAGDPVPHHRSASPSANRLVAGIIGLLFLILGALSFTALGSNPQLLGEGESLLFGAFQVSGLLIAIRIIFGLALLLATRDTVLGSARTNIWVGVFSLLVAVAAPFIDTATDVVVFGLTQADYILFAVAAIVLISAGVFLDRDHTRGRSAI